MGMVVDALFKTAESSADVSSELQLYKTTLGAQMSELLDATLVPLKEAVDVGAINLPSCSGLDDKVAALCEAAVSAWAGSNIPSEGPNRRWLANYLLVEVPGQVYKAFNQADLVWAVYSYFAWKQYDTSSDADAEAAKEGLTRIAGLQLPDDVDKASIVTIICDDLMKTGKALLAGRMRTDVDPKVKTFARRVDRLWAAVNGNASWAGQLPTASEASVRARLPAVSMQCTQP